ncbi:DUF2489 domain-containing protein [Aliiglaciecola sp. CAU 1673]|uniref:DUF2489 domain-containing protein n=1 Tax=Aliiglaciecola sp. CAU 1673 TaxID=3032595 RepID=UPI0023DC6CBA|nr:DUF2489 domain-containing protein [Aliiglaciecola sp. CAU 1673]MDF2179739.1 DUF2489 domain-containing protein [Aliiglaciecola sp. CAU 1673]
MQLGLTLAVVSAVVIIVALGVYAGRLLYLLHHQQQQQKRQLQQRQDYLVSSIRTIAMAVEQQQCELSEASIRLCVLLDNLPAPVNQAYSQRFSALYELYSKVQHMPTHKAWSALPKTERRKMEQQRGEFEAELETRILKEAAELKDFLPG